MVRFGVIGLGDIAVTQHLPALKRNPDAVIAGISTRNEERLEEIKKEYQVPFATTDYHELLKRDDIDAVIVATPQWVTPEITIAALEAGKDVLCEKPVAMTIPEAEKMKEAAARTGRKLMVGMCHHNDPILEKLRDWVRAGKVGSPVLMRVSIYDEYWDPETNPEHYNRIMKTLEHGSTSVHEGSHIFDWLHVVTGQEMKSVHSFGFKSRPEFPASNYDITIVNYMNGDMAKVEIGWFLKQFPGYTFEAVGPYGIASMNSYDRSATLKTDEEEIHWKESSGKDWMTSAFDLQTERFIRVVEQGEKVDPDIDDAIYTMKATDAVRKSLETGKPVEIENGGNRNE